MPIIILLSLILLIIIYYIFSKNRYYKLIFSDAHYLEVCRWVIEVIDKHPIAESKLENGTAFKTSFGLILAYTSLSDNGKRIITFSISESSGLTKGAVGGRFIFLLIRLFHKIKCNSNIFRTQSSVHYIEITIDEITLLEMHSADNVLGDMKNYRSMNIQQLNVAQQGDAPEPDSRRS